MHVLALTENVYQCGNLASDPLNWGELPWFEVASTDDCLQH